MQVKLSFTEEKYRPSVENARIPRRDRQGPKLKYRNVHEQQ
jgi:hypothetical protein